MHQPFLRRLVAGGVAATLVAALSVAFAGSATAATGPVDLDEATGDGDITSLMAGSAALSSGMSTWNSGAQPKHFWVDGFQAGRSATWSVQTDEASAYHAVVLLDGEPGQQWRLSSGTDSIDFTTRYSTWDRLDIGALDIAVNDSVRLEAINGTGSVKAVELVRDDAWDALNTRAAQFSAAAAPTRDAFSQTGWGLFFQYGAWGYPQSGSARLGIEESTNAFDVEDFADWVEESGAGYVIWSASWWTFELSMPNDALDAILGDGSRTTERNLIGEIAAELKSRGLMFLLYYHTGQDEHLGYGSTDWWQAQQWPSEFTPTGTGDRSVFFENWKNVISEIGTRLGTDLDGMIFDDGVLYYPTNFEELGAAARAGNPARLLSYNSWIAPSYTPFQDVMFGEDCEPRAGSAPDGGNGVLVDGPFEGQLEHCMIRFENDWGVKEANQPISARFSAEDLACQVEDKSRRNAPVSISMMMWSMDPNDPSSKARPSAQSLATIQEMTEIIDSGTDRVNDSSSAFQYGDGWGYSYNRTPGDVCRDVHYTTQNGASATIRFTGTGATLIGPVDQNSTIADVSVDGGEAERITVSRSGYTAQVPIFEVSGLEPGEHEIVITKRGGEYLQLDAMLVAEATGDGIPITGTIPEAADGALVMTVAEFGDGVQLSAPENLGDRLRLSGTLPDVTVTDSRNAQQAGSGGWSVSGQASAFTSAGRSLGAEHLGWTPTVQTPRTGLSAGAAVATVLDGGPGLAAPSALATATSAGRFGSATLGAGLALEVPVDTAPGTYTGVMTVSLFPVD